MRTKILATSLGLLIVSLGLAYWLGVFGRYEQLGTANLKSIVLECTSESNAKKAAERLNRLDWNAVVGGELASRGEQCIAESVDCRVEATASGTRVMVNGSYLPWQERRYSLAQLTTTWDEENAECAKRNAAIERAIVDVCSAVVPRDGT